MLHSLKERSVQTGKERGAQPCWKITFLKNLQIKDIFPALQNLFYCLMLNSQSQIVFNFPLLVKVNRKFTLGEK